MIVTITSERVAAMSDQWVHGFHDEDRDDLLREVVRYPELADRVRRLLAALDASGRNYNGQQVDLDFDLDDMLAALSPSILRPAAPTFLEQLTEIRSTITDVISERVDEDRKLHARIDRIGKGVDEGVERRLKALEAAVFAWTAVKPDPHDVTRRLLERINPVAGAPDVVTVHGDPDVEEIHSAAGLRLWLLEQIDNPAGPQ